MKTHEQMQATWVIFADGASSGNPGPGGWGAIVVSPEGQVTELGNRNANTTNNQMELDGVIHALGAVKPDGHHVWVYTDSTYVIRGITQWIWAWRKRGWKTSEGNDVQNVDYWKRLSQAVAQVTEHSKIEWKYVKGHSGVPGNERVDEIAVSFSKGKRPSLYRGSLLKYDIAVMDLPEDRPLPEMKSHSSGTKPAVFSYLSLVNGKLERHRTWAECEARVKGRPGAKFKKALSEEDERVILKSWGLKS